MNRRILVFFREVSALTTIAIVGGLLLSATSFADQQAGPKVKQISSDPFTDSDAQHQSEVEPDTYAWGNTIVVAHQTGRIFDGGSSDIGFAISTNGGTTWSHGFLPGITVNYQGGHFAAASDPSVVYDASHGVWLIASLGLSSNNSVFASSSRDGMNWNNPVTVDNQSGFADKDWITCDNTSTSPYYGHCYIEWDDAGIGDVPKMSTSTDGGQTWSAVYTISSASGLGGQPVVQPNGTAVVPFEGFSGIQAYSSTDGGKTWKNVVTVANISDHGVAGNLRTSPLPSAEVDGGGTVYVVWQDCRFRTGCSSNDIVMSTSTDGRNWSSVSRIPIDPVSSTVDHFIPGIAVDRATSGSTAHLGLTFYYYPVSNCSSSTCKLGVGFISSHDGGKTWANGTILGAGIKTPWLAVTNQGYMVGDYMSTSFVNGKAYGAFAGATPPNGSTLHENMYTPNVGLLQEGSGPSFSSANDKPVPNAKSDHGPRKFWDDEGRLPVHPPDKH